MNCFQRLAAIVFGSILVISIGTWAVILYNVERQYEADVEWVMDKYSISRSTAEASNWAGNPDMISRLRESHIEHQEFMDRLHASQRDNKVRRIAADRNSREATKHLREFHSFESHSTKEPMSKVDCVLNAYSER